MPKARERGEHKRGMIPPLVKGVWVGGLPRETVGRFGHKDISYHVRNRMLEKNCFQTFTCFFFTFFSSACFFDIISSMSPQVLAKNF